MSIFKSQILMLCGFCILSTSSIVGESPQLGEAITPEQIAAHRLTVLPSGDGLPPGSGAAVQGEALYQRHCLACHGIRGQDGLSEPLAGGQGTLNTEYPTKTIGSYWPQAVTVFDYIRRAMPYATPGTLLDDEVYALTAYLLHINGIIEKTEKIDAESLPEIKMPNRDGFTWVVK
ncbi:MAG: cytochrome c [Pseudomonadota bacterium]